ncbi:MAG: iron-sulfur cluster assembly accessory protein [Bacillota bacterium]
MLTLSPTAAAAVRIVSEHFGAAGLRISSPPELTPGEYALDVVSAPEEYDVLVESSGATVFLDLAASVDLDALMLDAHIGAGGMPEFGVVAP